MDQKSADTLRRLCDARLSLLVRYPFFGRLLLRLKLGVAKCGTACTDMKDVAFDPDFASRLSDEQLTFVLLHELYHCVLKHCTRGVGRSRLLYNVSSDIVANSHILGMMGLTDFMVDGENAMHLTPKGDEGRLYTAEEVYDMLSNMDD